MHVALTEALGGAQLLRLGASTCGNVPIILVGALVVEVVFAIAGEEQPFTHSSGQELPPSDPVVAGAVAHTLCAAAHNTVCCSSCT